MNAGVMVVLATLGFAALAAVGAIVIHVRRELRARAQTRRAQEGLAAHSHHRTAAVRAGAAAHRLVSQPASAGQPLNVVAAGAPPDPAATATYERSAL